MSSNDPNYRYSMETFVTDGTDREYQISFDGGYISQADVQAYSVLASESGLDTDRQAHTVLFISESAGSSQVRVTPVPVTGRKLTIYRNTEKSQSLLDFSDNSIITAANLDLGNEQATFNSAELADQLHEVSDIARTAYDAVAAAAGDWDNLQFLATKDEVTYGDTHEASLRVTGDANTLIAANAHTDSSITTISASILASLASATGASLIGFTATAGVKKMLDDLWNQGLTVENFGAVGDGVTSDQAAFSAMLTSLGYIRLRKKSYFINNWTPATFNSVVIRGAGRAQANGTFTGYMDGTGSIIVGRIFFRGTFGVIEDLCSDVGDTRTNITSEIDSLIFDAPTGGAGQMLYVKNVGCCGRTAATVSHGFLFEGFNNFNVSDIEVLQHNYGVVCKSRNGFVGNIRSYGVKVAGLYIRGSDSASAGGVASGAVDNVLWRNVISDASTSTGTQPGYAVWVEASSANVTRVTGYGAHCTGGRGVYRCSAAGAFLTAGVSARGLRSTNTTLCWETLGTTYETVVDDYYAENPSSGEAFETDVTSNNWRATNGIIVITVAGITGTSFALMRGTGYWDGIISRTINTMLITHSLTAIRGGRKYGTIKYSGEGTLALGGSIVAAAGEIVPNISMKPDNTVVLHGVLNPSAGSSSLAGLTGSMNFGTNRYFTAVARTTASAYTTADLLASGTSLTLLAPAANTLNQISLDNVIVHWD